MDTIADPDLSWRELIPRVRFHSSRNIERRGANTLLPLNGGGSILRVGRWAVWASASRVRIGVRSGTGVLRGCWSARVTAPSCSWVWAMLLEVVVARWARRVGEFADGGVGVGVGEVIWSIPKCQKAQTGRQAFCLRFRKISGMSF